MKRIAAFSLLCGFGFGADACVGCAEPCRPAHPLESGIYDIGELFEGDAADEWLTGTELEFDRADRTVRIRYMRNGSTFVVSYETDT